MAVNYLNNKDMLSEIHKSKSTYCAFISDDDKQYDLILPSVNKINIRTVAQAKRERAKRISKRTGEIIKPQNFDKNDVVFRIMTFDHIPNSNRKAKESAGSINYVPTDSLISITVVPVYSRNKISKFNLKDFASGRLTKNQGFI